MSRFPEGTIVRHVRVDRTRTPQAVIDATGRKQYVEKEVLETIPKGEGNEVDVYFVPKNSLPLLKKEISAFLAQYGLVPDPRAQAAVNEQDPSFADEYPNGTQWGDKNFLKFGGWGDRPGVSCGCDDDGWIAPWFLSGVLASCA
ncbi:MAG: hypothetical protein WAV50_03575 [Minisyncoccia bacterium]